MICNVVSYYNIIMHVGGGSRPKCIKVVHACNFGHRACIYIYIIIYIIIYTMIVQAN